MTGAVLAIAAILCMVAWAKGVPIRAILLALTAGIGTYGICLGVFLL